MDIDGVSSGDNSGDDLTRLVELTESKHELWEQLADCQDEELRSKLFDQLAAYREELARLSETVNRELDEPGATSQPVVDAPESLRPVGEVDGSSLLIPPVEVVSAPPLSSERSVADDPSDNEDQKHESENPPVRVSAAPIHVADDRTDAERIEPATEAGPETVALVASDERYRSTPATSGSLARVRSATTKPFPKVATLVGIGAVALIAWFLFFGPDSSTDAPLDETAANGDVEAEVAAVDQIRAVLDGLGYGSVVIEERAGTVFLGGVVGSESDRNAVIGASQALTRGMPLDSRSLAIGTVVEGTNGEVDEGGDPETQQPAVTSPAVTGAFIEASLDGKDFVLAGVVPSAELAGQYLRAAEIAYSPYIRSELVVDEQLELVDWLSRGPDAIVMLPLMIEGRILISDGQVHVSGRSPDEAGVERLQGALSQITGLPVVVSDVEVANLQPPTYVIAADAGLVELDGMVPTEEIRAMLVEGAQLSYGPDNVTDRITVNPNVYPSLWMYSAGPLMQAMSTFPDYELRIDGTAFSGFINGGVTFESNSATFSGNYAEVLDVGVGVLTRDPSLQLVIEGHTDNLGSDEGNLALSQLRAEAVRDYFIAHGIDAARLTAVGFGETEPVVSNDTAAGRARNRRIQYVLSTGS